MDEDLRRVLAEQAAAIAEVRENTRLIYRYIYWQRILGWIKWLLLILSLLAGVIYLPPLLKDSFSLYSSILR
jgi:hypothetical protein